MTYEQDRYNSIRQPNDYRQDRYWYGKVKTLPSYTPSQGEELSTYISRLGQAIREANEASTWTHIKGSKGPWLTHRSAASCFMCQDIQIENIIYKILTDLKKLKSTDKYQFNVIPANENTPATFTLTKTH